jgi:hypothetical protein
MFWGGVGYNGKTPLAEISTRLDSGGYIDILKKICSLVHPKSEVGAGFSSKIMLQFTHLESRRLGLTERMFGFWTGRLKARI